MHVTSFRFLFAKQSKKTFIHNINSAPEAIVAISPSMAELICEYSPDLGCSCAMDFLCLTEVNPSTKRRLRF